MPTVPISPMPAVQGTSKSIETGWVNTSMWGIFASRRKVEVQLVSENEPRISLISQTGFGHFLEAIGLSQEWGKKADPLAPNADLIKICKNVFNKACGGQYSVIFKSDLKKILAETSKTPKENIHSVLTETINTRVTAHFKDVDHIINGERWSLQREVGQAVKKLELFGSARTTWRKFSETIFDPSKDMEDLREGFAFTQVHSLQSCQVQVMGDLERALGEGMDSEHPFRPVNLVDFIDTQPTLVENRAKRWEDIGNQILKAQSVEELTKLMGVIEEEKQIDTILQKVLSQHRGESDLFACLQEIQNEASTLVHSIDPSAKDPVTLEEIHRKVDFYQIPRNRDALARDQRAALKDLQFHVRCLELVQAQQISQMKSETDRMKSKIDSIKQQISDFIKQIQAFSTNEKAWSDLSKKISEFNPTKASQADLQSIQQEFESLRVKSLEDCRREVLDEIDMVLKEGDLSEESPQETPPFLPVRFARFLHSDMDPEISALVKDRAQVWENYKDEVDKAKSVEDLAQIMNILHEEEMVDDILHATLTSHASEGVEKCLVAVQKEASEMLQSIDPSAKVPMQFMEIQEKVSFYQKPQNKAKLNPDQNNKLEDLQCYVRCLDFMKREQISRTPREKIEGKDRLELIRKERLEELKEQIKDLILFGKGAVVVPADDEGQPPIVIDGVIPFCDLFSQILLPHPGAKTIIAEREEFWENFLRDLEDISTPEGLNDARKVVEREQQADRLLFDILTESPTNSPQEYQELITKKAAALLQKIDSTINPEDVATPEQIFSKIQGFETDVDNFRQLFPYQNALKFLQDVQTSIEKQKQVALVYEQQEIVPLTDILHKPVDIRLREKDEVRKPIIAFLSQLEKSRQAELRDILELNPSIGEASLDRFVETQKLFVRILSVVFSDSPDFARPEMYIPDQAMDFALIELGTQLPRLRDNPLTKGIIPDDFSPEQSFLKELEEITNSLPEEGLDAATLASVHAFKNYATIIRTLANATQKHIEQRVIAFNEEIFQQLREESPKVFMAAKALSMSKGAEQQKLEQFYKGVVDEDLRARDALQKMILKIPEPEEDFETMDFNTIRRYFRDSTRALNLSKSELTEKQTELQKANRIVKHNILLSLQLISQTTGASIKQINVKLFQLPLPIREESTEIFSKLKSDTNTFAPQFAHFNERLKAARQNIDNLDTQQIRELFQTAESFKETIKTLSGLTEDLIKSERQVLKPAEPKKPETEPGAAQIKPGEVAPPPQ